MVDQTRHRGRGNVQNPPFLILSYIYIIFIYIFLYFLISYPYFLFLVPQENHPRPIFLFNFIFVPNYWVPCCHVSALPLAVPPFFRHSQNEGKVLKNRDCSDADVLNLNNTYRQLSRAESRSVCALLGVCDHSHETCSDLYVYMKADMCFFSRPLKHQYQCSLFCVTYLNTFLVRIKKC